MTIPFRLALASTITAALLLAGCAKKTDTRPATAATTSTSGTRAPRPSTPAPQPTHPTTTASDAGLPDRTGISACDDYLSSYLACHRAAGIFSAEQLPMRYEAMRTNLLRDSQNPDVRPQLAERCNSLARSLRQALHGKSCAATPAPASSTP